MMQCPRCGAREFRLKGVMQVDVVVRIDCLSVDDVFIEQEWMDEPPDDLDLYEDGIECLHCHGWCSQAEARTAFAQAMPQAAPNDQQESLFHEDT